MAILIINLNSFFYLKVLDDAFGHEQKKMGGLLPLRNSVWPMGIVQRHSRASTIRGDCNAYILQYHLNR